MTETVQYGEWGYPLTWGETLSNHDWVPLYVNRLLTSQFVAYACAQGRREDIGTALILWCESFKQDPAGTLPDDDVELAQIARFGADVDAWRAARKGVLHGWERVTIDGDGVGAGPRLGHMVIAKIAQDMHRRKSGRDAAREASRMSSLRSRVRAKIKGLGYAKPHYGNAQIINLVSEWLDRHNLYCTDENVSVAMLEAVGIPRDVTPLRRGTNGG